jgi:hypothetical protein
MSQSQPDELLPARLVCRRYNVVSRTVDRWLEAGILPQPIRVIGLRYWRLSDLERAERAGMGGRKTEDAA